jgi:predicted ATPase
LVADGGDPLQCRVGINTGEVVVRTISTGGGHVEYTPIGHTTNLASRMQAVAPVGSIAITDTTRKLCEGYFALKPLGKTKVKGVSEAVSVYEVTGLGPLRTRLQRSAGRGLTKFVGREREMDAMRNAAELANSGRGQIVAAIAEAGTGKSRLFYEFKAKNQSGWIVLETFSVSHGKASAYFPVIDLLHSYFGIDSADNSRKRQEKVAGKIAILDRALEDTLPHLFGLLGIVEGGDPLAEMDARVKKRRTLDAIKRILLRESLNQSLMVIFEDLHWIDEATQEFLNLLADSIANAKILLLVNYRPEYSHHWNSKTYYMQLRLDPLGKESADEMLSALLGDEADPAPLKHLIIERTEGNPFFMEEMVQALYEDGALVRNGAAHLARPLDALKIPATVQAILAARIDRLPPEEKDLLQTLAVIGKEFPFSLAREVIKKPDDDLNQMLSDLQLAEFIYEQPAIGDTEYSFKHALTQEVAYNSVLIERRKVLHARIGAAIEDLHVNRLDDCYAELAYHYGRSSHYLPASRYLLFAARVALGRSAYAESLRHASTALSLLKNSPASEERASRELELLVTLANASEIIHGPTSPETGAEWTRARELCLQMTDTPRLFQVLKGISSFHRFRAEYQKARGLGEEAIGIAERLDDSSDIAAGCMALGNTLLYIGDFQGTNDMCERALALNPPGAESAPGARRTRVLSLIFSGRALWFLGYADQALNRTRDALGVARQAGDPSLLTDALVFGADVFQFCLDLEAVKQHAAEIIELTTEHGLAPWYLGTAKFLHGWVLAEQGHPGAAISLITEGIATVRATGFANYTSFQLGVLAKAHSLASNAKEALKNLDKALAFAEENDERFCQAQLQALRGEFTVRHSLGNAAEAANCFARALEVARSQKAKSWQLRATTSLARLMRDTGRCDNARSMLVEIYNWFTEGFDTADLKDAKGLLDELHE